MKEKCPFCNTDTLGNDYIKECKNKKCKSKYFTVNQCHKNGSSTSIESFSTKDYKIECYTNSCKSITKISSCNKDKWINDKIKISDYNLNKINEKLDKILIML